MKLFIIESPNPMDLLQDRSEMRSLEQICKMFEHQVATFFVKSKQEYIDTIKYISTLDKSHDKFNNCDEPLCLHISAHGNSDGIAFGNDNLSWDELYKNSIPLFELFGEYPADRILVISSCQAANQKVTKSIKGLLEGSSIEPPSYLFTSGIDNVAWIDTITCWTLFYRLIRKENLRDKTKIMKILDKINSLNLDKITYFRWDSRDMKYYKYTEMKRTKSK